MNRDSILIIDVETTGLCPISRDIWEVALVSYQNRGGAVLNVKIKVNADACYWDLEALRISRTKGMDGERYYEKQDAVYKIYSFVRSTYGREKPILAGHNVGFDISFLKKLFHPHPFDFVDYHSIDTFSMAQAMTAAGLLPNGMDRLKDLAEYYGIKNINPHSALSDADTTRGILKAMFADLDVMKEVSR